MQRAFHIVRPLAAPGNPRRACYTVPMQDEQEFRRAAEAAIDGLKHHLFAREEEAQTAFEVEEQGGVLNVLFDDPGARFVITPNVPVRQILDLRVGH